jgi:hypothetical protein
MNNKKKHSQRWIEIYFYVKLEFRNCLSLKESLICIKIILNPLELKTWESSVYEIHNFLSNFIDLNHIFVYSNLFDLLIVFLNARYLKKRHQWWILSRFLFCTKKLIRRRKVFFHKISSCLWTWNPYGTIFLSSLKT